MEVIVVVEEEVEVDVGGSEEVEVEVVVQGCVGMNDVEEWVGMDFFFFWGCLFFVFSFFCFFCLVSVEEVVGGSSTEEEEEEEEEEADSSFCFFARGKEAEVGEEVGEEVGVGVSGMLSRGSFLFLFERLFFSSPHSLWFFCSPIHLFSCAGKLASSLLVKF